MREIKFRVWIKVSQKIASWEMIKEKKNLHRLIENPEYLLMQYTGLKDKNNVEIFEGDIIRSHNSRQGEKIEDYEVIYAGSGFCIKSLKENEIHSKGTLYSFALYSDNIDFLKDDYIIGNIYEDSHLLDNN